MCTYKQLSSGLHTLSSESYSPAHSCVLFWRNGFFATARGIGFETSVLDPCVLVLIDSQQRYHGIIGVANGDIAGGGDEVW